MGGVSLMASTFFARAKQLQKRVGTGDLEGSVTYDQVYAKYQHERVDLEHPQGGEAKYLEKAQKATYERNLKRIADGVLEDGGKRAMEQAMETLVLESSRRAPIGPPHGDSNHIEARHPGLLRASAHARVTDDGHVVFDRPGAPREHNT